MAATQTSPQQQQETRQTFESLKPGDRIEVVHVVTIGPQTWTTTAVGTVVRAERGGTACTSAAISTTKCSVILSFCGATTAS